MFLFLFWQTGTIFCSCGVGNPIAGAGSFFADCINTFFFLFYLLAWFRLRLGTGAFSVGSSCGFRPVTGFSCCCTFGLDAFFFLYYFFTG
jgi:hypothetical protein